jgi:hypothetical protein
MSCRGDIHIGDDSEIFYECIHPDTINFCAKEGVLEDGMTAEIDLDNKNCVISIEIGSNAYKSIQKYFKRSAE